MSSPLKDVGERQWCCLFCCNPVSISDTVLNFTGSCIDYSAFTVTFGWFTLALRTYTDILKAALEAMAWTPCSSRCSHALVGLGAAGRTVLQRDHSAAAPAAENVKDNVCSDAVLLFSTTPGRRWLHWFASLPFRAALILQIVGVWSS